MNTPSAMEGAAFETAWARLLRLLGPGWADAAAALNGLPPAQWTDLLALADRHWVTPLLHRRLASCAALADGPPGAFPGAVRTEFRKRYLRSAFRHARLAARAAPVLAACRAAGIDVLVLKGSHLAPVVYGRPAERPMSDVDLLVRPRDLDATIGILTGLGFTQADQDDRGAPVHNVAHDDNHELRPFRHPGRIQIDLHYALASTRLAAGIDHEALFRRATPLRVGGAEALGLAPEDLLLHLCLHIALKDRFAVKLLSLADLPLVVEHHGDGMDWAVVRERARAWGVERSVLLTFALVERLLGWRVPEGALHGLGALPDGVDLLALAERQVRLRSVRPRMAEIARFDTVTRALGGAGLSGGVGTLVRRMLPSRREMAALYGVPPESPRLLACYPRRLGSLVARYGPLLVRALLRRSDATAILAVGRERNRLAEWLAGG